MMITFSSPHIFFLLPTNQDTTVAINNFDTFHGDLTTKPANRADSFLRLYRIAVHKGKLRDFGLKL